MFPLVLGTSTTTPQQQRFLMLSTKEISFSGDIVSKFNRIVINLDMMMQNWKEEHPGKPLDGIFAVLSKAKKNLSKTDCKTEFVDLRQYKG